MKTNIAQRFIARYDSKDFKSDYLMLLAESFSNNEGDVINRIIDLFNVSNYETEKALSNHFVIGREEAKKIYDFIDENLEEFTTSFNSYYVGYTSLESVAFGEQEEQLTGIYNHVTGGIYSLPYLQKTFEKEGYYVNGEYAYYNILGGLHIDLLNNIELLNNFLSELKVAMPA